MGRWTAPTLVFVSDPVRVPRSSLLTEHSTTALVAWVTLTQFSQRGVQRRLTAVLRVLHRASASQRHLHLLSTERTD